MPAVVGVALGLRLWGIAFGLPHLYHPDEPAHVLQALAIGRGLPNGLTFGNPPLYKYLLLAEYAVTYGLGRLTGAYASPQDFVTQFRADPTLLYLIGRSTSAFLGAATIVAIYLLAATLRGRHVGLLAAWTGAVAYLLVRDSHFAVNDALVTLVVTLALLFCVRVAQGGGVKEYLVAGALVGLAFAAKYHGAAALLSLILAHVIRPSQRHLGQLILSVGAAAAAVALAFPSLVLETSRVLQDIQTQLYSRGQTGYDGLDPAGGYVYYVKVFVLGLGWPVLVAACVGMLLAIVRRDRLLLVVGSLPLTLYAIMGYERMFFARFLLPAMPAMFVLAAIVIDLAAQGLPRRTAGFLHTVGSTPALSRLHSVSLPDLLQLAAAVVLGLPLLLDSIHLDVLLTRPDTRTEASAWIASHLPPGIRVAVDQLPLGPLLPPDRYDLLFADSWSLFDLAIDEYRRRGIEYLVASSYTSDRWLLDPTKDQRRRAFQAALDQDAQLAAEFRPHLGDEKPPFVYDQIYAPFDHLERLERPGPTVKVYRLTPPKVRR